MSSKASQILDGKVVAKKILDSLESRIQEFQRIWDRSPKLAVILANNTPASAIYVNKKVQACKKLDLYCHVFHSDKRRAGWTSSEFVSEKLYSLQEHERDKEAFWDGIIVQLPIEECPDPRPFYDAIDPLKDVDCFHPVNVGLLSQGRPRFLPCTPAGIIEILNHYEIPIKSQQITIINNSDIVGKPLAMMLTMEGATVSVCHRDSQPQDIKDLCQKSDIVVVGVGKAGFLTKEYVNEYTVVIDVGISRVNDKVVGDAHPEIFDVVKAYTKTPGGTGLTTVACLMRNVVTAAELQM